MKYLKSILENLKIFDQESFDKFLFTDGWRQSELELLRSSDIRIDDESRLYGDRLSFTKKIIDIPKIKIQNSSEIEFKDCIICGNVFISQKEEKSTKLFFDYCIVLGSVVIHGIVREGYIVTVERLNCQELCLNNINTREVSLSNSHIFRLHISDSQIDNLFTFENRFDFVDIVNSKILESSFEIAQLDERNLLSFHDERVIENKKKQLNLFDFNYIEKASTSSYTKSNRESLLFLIEKTSLKSYREKYSHVLYLENLSSQKRLLSKLLLRALGCFIKPIRVILLGLCVYLLSTILYTLPCMPFVKDGKVVSGLNFADSLYFSGITFTTIGYGNFAPIGLTRIFVVVEGFLGVLFISAFLVSLVRRYSER